MTKTLRLSLALAAMLFTLPASAASLIQNGSFEDTNSTAGLVSPFTAQDALAVGDWNVYNTMPGGWYSGTKGFELQRNTIVTAQDGTNYIELESHPGDPSVSRIMQDFTVAAGDAGLYVLSFYYQPRTSTPGDNLINAIFGTETETVSGPPVPALGTWTNILVYSLLGVGTHTLEFNAFGTLFDNTLGGFIDNVSVELIRRDAPAVPLPAGLVLLLTGLGGLGFLGRSRAKSA